MSGMMTPEKWPTTITLKCPHCGGTFTEHADDADLTLSRLRIDMREHIKDRHPWLAGASGPDGPPAWLRQPEFPQHDS